MCNINYMCAYQPVYMCIFDLYHICIIIYMTYVQVYLRKCECKRARAYVRVYTYK